MSTRCRNRLVEQRVLDEGSLEDNAGFASRMFFFWVFPLLRFSFRNSDDLPRLPRSDQPGFLAGKFHVIFMKAPKITKNLLLLTLLYKVQPKVFLSSLLCGWTFLLCMLLDPIMLESLLANAESIEHHFDISTVNKMVVLVLSLSFCMAVRVANMEVCFFYSVRVMNNARTAIVHAVFKESMQRKSLKTPDVGHWSNLMSTDADKFGKMGWIIFSLSQWTWSVTTIPIVVYFIHKVIGLPAAMAGCSVLFLGQWAMRKLADRTKIIVKNLQEARDVRSRLITEYVMSARLVKLHSLDRLWENRLQHARENELIQLRKMRYWNAFNSFIGQLFNFLLPVTIFTTYVLEGHELTGSVVFTTLAWIQQMTWTLQSLPGAFNMYAELSPSLTRLSDFLMPSLPEAMDGAHRNSGCVELNDGDLIRSANSTSKSKESHGIPNHSTNGDRTSRATEPDRNGTQNQDHIGVDQKHNQGGNGKDGENISDIELLETTSELLDTTSVGTGEATRSTPLLSSVKLYSIASRTKDSFRDGAVGSADTAGDSNIIETGDSSMAGAADATTDQVVTEAIDLASDQLYKWYQNRAVDNISLNPGVDNISLMSPRTTSRVQRSLSQEAALTCRNVVCGYISDNRAPSSEDNVPSNVTDVSDALLISRNNIREPFQLQADFTVYAGQLVVFCGAVGSGKSTLLACLAQARPLISGDILIPDLQQTDFQDLRNSHAGKKETSRDVAGFPKFEVDVKPEQHSANRLPLELGRSPSQLSTVSTNSIEYAMGASWSSSCTRALVTQKPFILNGSIRENILFHSAMDQGKYLDVLRKCCLLPDLEALPDNDQTLVGEAGVQLSGGQKARLGLARALYSDADLLFLDDVLSAVDAHTGRFIFDNVFCPLIQQGRTVFLVTHQLQYLARKEISSIYLLSQSPAATTSSQFKVEKTSLEAMQRTGLPDFCVTSSDDDLKSPTSDTGATYTVAGTNHENGKKSDKTESIDRTRSDRSVERTLDRAGSNSSQEKAVGRSVGKVLSKESVKESVGDGDYLKRLEHLELVSNSQSHTVYLNEATERVAEILRTMEGQRISNRIVDQVTNLLLGSEEETRYSERISSTDFGLYLSAFGTVATNAFLFLLIVLLAVSSVLGPLWLTHWANTNDSTHHDPRWGNGSGIIRPQVANVDSGGNTSETLGGSIVAKTSESDLGSTFAGQSPVASALPLTSTLQTASQSNVGSFQSLATESIPFVGIQPFPNVNILSSFFGYLFPDSAVNDIDAHGRGTVRSVGVIAKEGVNTVPREGGEEKPNQLYFLGVYILINLFSAATSALQTIILTVCSLKASRSVHAKMLKNLLNAPLSFFDITPTGRIINRFLQDMQNLDNYVPSVIIQQLQFSLTMITQISLIFIYCPIVLFLCPMILIPYIYIFKRIRAPARDTRRIESIAHSPVYAEYVDCLRGLDTIRAMSKENSFISSNLEKVNQMAKGRYWNEAVGKWAQSLTTLLGCVLYLIVGLTGCFYYYVASHESIVGMHSENGSADNSESSTSSGFKLSAADLGLVLMYAGILQRSLMDYCMGLTNLEQNFVSVERCAEFCRLPQEQNTTLVDSELVAEASDLLANNQLVPSMPTGGGNGESSAVSFDRNGTSAATITNPVRTGSLASSPSLEESDKKREIPFPVEPTAGRTSDNSPTRSPAKYQSPRTVALEVRDLGLRYRLHKQLVLQHVNFQVQKGEKVAILGRTGSGKSSLFNALSGLYPLRSGSSVFIDGEELCKDCGTVYWRQNKFRMISQESLLVSGTIRENLISHQISNRQTMDKQSDQIGNPAPPSSGLRQGFSPNAVITPGSHRIRGQVSGRSANSASSNSPDSNDDVIWGVLETVGLADKVRSVGGLDFEVDAVGDNFSSGERQLFAVARALVDKPQLLFCDEATANVDLVADDRLHNIILDKMTSVTVLWIMHRLHFVDKFDKIFIFDKGRLVETGTPKELKSQGGRLNDLLQEASQR